MSQTQFWIETLALWQPFKTAFLFAWGSADPPWLFTLKRLFLLMPLGAIAAGYWTSVLSVPTLIVRSKRKAYFSLLLVTWWDLGRATFTFWGGTFRFVLQLAMSLLGTVQVVLVGIWAMLQELVLLPFRTLRNIGANALSPGTPWIAVGMTFVWCVFEAIIFTYVMTPLVIDTLSNIAGTELTEAAVRIPLFLFMFFIILGSYAVLSNLTAALRTRNIASIVKIAVVEVVAASVEVVFLYREFVDSLVPWFAQHASRNFDLGITGTLLIGGFTWLGVRSLSWFLFAGSGTPTILAIIQRQGVGNRNAEAGPQRPAGLFSDGFSARLRKEFDWVAAEGERLLDAFLVPPMQMVAAALNFCTMLAANRHLLELPLRSVRDFKDARTLVTELKTTRSVEARAREAA